MERPERMTACLLYCDHSADVQALLNEVEKLQTERSMLQEQIDQHECDPPIGVPC